MSGGQFNCPIVFRGPNASARQVGCQHSPRDGALLRARSRASRSSRPRSPADAKGLLKAAIRDDNPVLFMEWETLYSVKGEVPDDERRRRRSARRSVVREGTDVHDRRVLRA